MDVCLINNHLQHFSFMSLIYCYTTAAWDCLTVTTAQENAGTNSFIKVLKISRLFRQDQDQDFFFKTKIKTETFYRATQLC